MESIGSFFSLDLYFDNKSLIVNFNIFQKTPGDELQPVYKMAQSSFASCLGLWNVYEGYKTFTMKKRNFFSTFDSFLKSYYISN
jgi:hypothetical protein